MAEKRIDQLTEKAAYTDINDSDVLPLHDVGVGSTFKTKIETLIKKVLGNRTIGGTASTDVTTNNATQTLTGKRLDSPKINESGTTSVTSTTLNALQAVAAKIGYLGDVTTNIGAAITAASKYSQNVDHTFLYSVDFASGETSRTVDKSTIFSSFSMSTSSYGILPRSIAIDVYSIDGSTYTKATSGITVGYTKSGVPSDLSSITISSLNAAKGYSIKVLFRVYDKQGV